MEAFLLKLLNMSLTGSSVILVVLLARLVLRRAPRAVSYALWAVPFLRLALPFSFESVYSLVRVRPDAIPPDIVYAAQPAIDSGVQPLDAVVNAALTAVPADPAASVNPVQVLLFIGFWIWLAGVCAIACASLIQTVRLRRYLKQLRHLEGNLYTIGRADTPFVFGLLRPRIYLPAGLDGAEYEYILAHERHHIARGDHLLRPLAFAVATAHWFNPLVWAAYWLLGVDMEQSCDEAVLRRFGGDIRKAYSGSLVNLASAPRALRPGPLGFAEGDIGRRVRGILRWKKPAVWVSVLAACAALLVACGLLSDPPGNAAAPADPDSSYPISESAADRWAYAHMERIEMILDDYIEIAHRGYGLQELGQIDGIAEEPVTIYRCEVYYVPADYETAYEALGHTAIEANFVKNGDQYEIRDIPGMSRVYFAFDADDTLLASFGSDYAQYYDDYPNESLGHLELMLRTKLESMQVIDAPTFDSTHYVVTYEEYHPGVYKKLLLSQPARQGADGIWHAERKMDQNGNVTLCEVQNFTALQKECDEGHRPALLDPEQVALEFIHRDYDTARIVEIREASYEEFCAWPTSTYEGYIFEVADGYLKLRPTVPDETGAPTLWATGYPQYYDSLPYRGDTAWTLDGEAVTETALAAAVEAAPADGLFAKCTYCGGSIMAVEAVTAP